MSKSGKMGWKTIRSGGGVLSSTETSERGAVARKEDISQAQLQYSVVEYAAGL